MGVLHPRMEHELIALADVNLPGGNRTIQAGDKITIEYDGLHATGSDLWISTGFERPKGLRRLWRRLMIRTLR